MSFSFWQERDNSDFFRRRNPVMCSWGHGRVLQHPFILSLLYIIPHVCPILTPRPKHINATSCLNSVNITALWPPCAKLCLKVFWIVIVNMAQLYLNTHGWSCCVAFSDTVLQYNVQRSCICIAWYIVAYEMMQIKSCSSGRQLCSYVLQVRLYN